jgi:hypothetical protein
LYSNGKTAGSGLGQRAIEDLELLDSEARVQEVLSEIVGAYGKVNSISLVPPKRQAVPNEYKYLVNFDSTLDAMAAASELKCLLIGFSALVVSVSRNAGYA